MQRTQTFGRNELLKEKEKKKPNRIPLILTYKRTLLNVKKVIVNNWNLLQINEKIQDIFQQIAIWYLEEIKTFTIFRM